MWGVRKDLQDTGDDEGLWCYDLLEEGALLLLSGFVISFGTGERRESIHRWRESKRELPLLKPLVAVGSNVTLHEGKAYPCLHTLRIISPFISDLRATVLSSTGVAIRPYPLINC